MIRPAVSEDADQIAGIYNPFIRETVATFEEVEVTPGEIARRIAATKNSGKPFLVWETDGVISGYAYGSAWKTRSAYKHTIEVSVYIDQQHQGRGLGRALYTELFSILRHMDYHAVIGVITLPNESSIRLHESFGLQKVAHFSEVGRKFGRWIDVGYWQGFLGEASETSAHKSPSRMD